MAADIVVDLSAINGAGILAVKNADIDCRLGQKTVADLKTAGITCVIASKFTRAVFRIMINSGIAPVMYAETDRISDGDMIEINLAEGRLTHNNAIAEITPLPDFMRKILSAGGLTAYTRQEIAAR
ncbi:MAG: hypothetical protein JW763_01525 [candidate division Zixibacteria bacterium]|nr:hypothetical protein [candidate division Zixibacteria bacterium]